GQDYPHEPEESGAAGYRAKVMGVADPVEDHERLAVVRPPPSRVWVEVAQWLRPGDRHDSAAQEGAGDARQFGAVDLPIRLVSAGEGAPERRNLACHLAIEEQPLHPPRITLEHSAHR